MVFKIHLLICILGGLLINSTRANELDPEVTPNSGPLNFCQTFASRTMDQLNDLTLEKIKEIKKIKDEINSFNANKNIIDSFLKIRKQYFESYKALSLENLKYEDNLSLKLDHFKNLLKTSLTLSAVNLLAKSEKESPNAKSIDQLCANAKNKKTNFCNYIINNKGDHTSGELETLNKTLANLYQALGASSNPEEIKAQLEVIYKNIPVTIVPEKILGDLLDSSPNLVNVLQKEDKQSIITCLSNLKVENSNTNSKCKSLLENPNARESFKNIISNEMNTIQKDFSKQKFDDLFATLETPPLKTKDPLLTSEFASYLENMRDDNNEDSKRIFMLSKESCIPRENKPIDFEKCDKYSNQIVTNFENENKSKENKINSAIKKLDLAISDDGELANIEKMKQYVTQKYLRKCDNSKLVAPSSNINAPCFSEMNLPGDSPPLKELESKLSNVIGELKTQNPLSAEKGELGEFSKKEIGIYQNYCNNTALREKSFITDICRDINSEAKKLSLQKENSEWDKFNKDYYVQYDPVATKGYKVYEKKSNLRILASGLYQSLNNVVPIWMGNMQMNYQIDYMTNQALYQKQMMYMNSLDSPWMNLPYFSGTYNQVGSGNLMNQGFNFSM